jgi:hypothetical protein
MVIRYTAECCDCPKGELEGWIHVGIKEIKYYNTL